MKQQPIIYGIVGLIIGVVLTGFVMANKNMQTTTEPSQSMNHGSSQMTTGSGMSMEEMMTDLEGKSGEEFDKAFLTAMIAHHTDALTMAENAKQKAQRNEIKDLADEIIAAQTAEINQMQEWKKGWRFTQ